MGSVFFVSDCHFRHDKPFLYEPRGFLSIDEHDETIVENWNSIIKDDDLIYNLGDLALSDVDRAIPYIQRLKGHQIWLRGNHCSKNKIDKILAACPKIKLVGALDTSWATIYQIGKWNFYLSHYPTKVGNYDDNKNFKWYCLCGHTHTKNKFADISDSCYHVELDAHNNFPVSLEEIKIDLKNYKELL